MAIGAPAIGIWLYIVCAPLLHIDGSRKSLIMASVSVLIAAVAIFLMIVRALPAFDTNEFVWSQWTPWALYAASMIPLWYLIGNVWDDPPPLGYLVEGSLALLAAAIWAIGISLRQLLAVAGKMRA